MSPDPVNASVEETLRINHNGIKNTLTVHRISDAPFTHAQPREVTSVPVNVRSDER
jgi:hypothetical protein